MQRFPHSLPLLLCILSLGVTGGCDTGPGEGLLINDILIGTGEEAERGKIVTFNYVGRFINGDIFDSSEAQGHPEEARLGAGELIEGLDQGILGMRVGGRRDLIVPPALAFGARGAGCSDNTPDDCVIPPNTTLRYEIELIRVRDPLP